MIEDKHKKWVITTPPKTGTYSLLSMLVPEYGKRIGKMHDTRYEGPAKQRIMIVRDPYDRFCSMYWFIRSQSHRKTFWTPFTNKTRDFNLFVKEWLRKRASGSKNLWCRTLWEFHKEFKPTDCWKLEEIAYYTELLGVRGVKWLNVTVEKKHGKREDWRTTVKGMDPTLKKQLIMVLNTDATHFGYAVRRS